jgi:WhiB family transcriptional regulator, redox-sensing transcriptional regulator
MTALEWMDDAACVGMDDRLFFDDQYNDYAEAAAVCAACPVRAACLAYALNNCIDHGFWGGTTGKERNRTRRQAGHFKPAANNRGHGTYWRYRHGKCRCDACRRTWANYQAAYRARRAS